MKGILVVLLLPEFQDCKKKCSRDLFNNNEIILTLTIRLYILKKAHLKLSIFYTMRGRSEKYREGREDKPHRVSIMSSEP